MPEIICPFCLNTHNFVDSFECPESGMVVPTEYVRGYSSVPPLFLALFGFPAHGKTTFFSALSLMLMEIGKRWKRASVKYLDQYTLDTFSTSQHMVSSGIFPTASFPNFPQPLLLNLHNIPGDRSFCLVLYDLIGEIYTSSLDSPEILENYIKPFKYIDTIWFLVSLPNLERDRNTLINLFNVYMVGLGQLGTRLSGRNVVIIYTKADLLLPELPEKVQDYLLRDPFAEDSISTFEAGSSQEFSLAEYIAEMKQVSSELESYTRHKVKGGSAFLNLTKSTGINVTFGITSALGYAPNPPVRGIRPEMRPRRVLDPLIWAIRYHKPIDQTEIFISYSRRDWEKHVEPLVEKLRKEGFRVWIDQHLLEGGQDWLDEINGALQRCKAMILCVSPEALESRWVKMEYRFFIREDKPILPLMCRSTTLPAELGGIQYLSPSEADVIVERLRKLTV